jgi:hypothetical protein
MWEQLSVLPLTSPGALEHNLPFYLLFIYTVRSFYCSIVLEAHICVLLVSQGHELSTQS